MQASKTTSVTRRTLTVSNVLLLEINYGDGKKVSTSIYLFDEKKKRSPSFQVTNQRRAIGVAPDNDGRIEGKTHVRHYKTTQHIMQPTTTTQQQQQ